MGMDCRRFISLDSIHRLYRGIETLLSAAIVAIRSVAKGIEQRAKRYSQSGLWGAVLLSDAAHSMSMSRYKSLGGPAGGFLLKNDRDMAATLDRAAKPMGMLIDQLRL